MGEKMRTLIILVAIAATALLGLGYEFEANATMGSVLQGLQGPVETLSPVEKATCDEEGVFCPKGSSLKCDPNCVCSACGSPARPHRHAKHS